MNKNVFVKRLLKITSRISDFYIFLPISVIKRRRTFYFEAVSPEGKVFSGYMTAVNNKVTDSFRSAFNAPQGKLKLQIRDCASNLTQLTSFYLE